jgi:hypothetical protein
MRSTFLTNLAYRAFKVRCSNALIIMRRFPDIAMIGTDAMIGPVDPTLIG